MLEQHPAAFPAAVRLQLERLQQAGEAPCENDDLTSRRGVDLGQSSTAQQPAVPSHTPSSSSSSKPNLQEAGASLGSAQCFLFIHMV